MRTFSPRQSLRSTKADPKKFPEGIPRTQGTKSQRYSREATEKVRVLITNQRTPFIILIGEVPGAETKDPRPLDLPGSLP